MSYEIGILRQCSSCDEWLSIERFRYARGHQCRLCAGRADVRRPGARIGAKARTITLTNKGREAIGIITPAA